MAMEFIPRHSVDWASLNPYLTGNQAGVESDTGKFKFGPGNWSTLSYAGGTSSGDPLVFNTLPTGSAISAAATASTVVTRDGNANIFADSIIPGVTSTVTAASTTTLTVDSTQVQRFTGTTTQTVLLPTTSVTDGRTFIIDNKSSGLVTIQSSGANTITYAAAGAVVVVQANTATPTTAAHWTVLAYSSTTGYTNGVPSTAMRDANNILSARVFLAGSTSTATAGTTTTLTVSSNSIQIFTGSTTQTCVLPTTTIILGWKVTIINKSSGAITVNSSGSGLVATVAGGAVAQIMANTTTPTTAAHWSVLSNGGTA